MFDERHPWSCARAERFVMPHLLKIANRFLKNVKTAIHTEVIYTYVYPHVDPDCLHYKVCATASGKEKRTNFTGGAFISLFIHKSQLSAVEEGRQSVRSPADVDG